MSTKLTAYLGADIFDGRQMRRDLALLTEGGKVRALAPEQELPAAAERIALKGGMLAPGLVDLQVNGGGGVMFNDDPAPETLRRIARAHLALGTTALLPTLITDTREKTRAAIAAAIAAVEAGEAGIAGLHLEGPHISVARKGAHAAELIRPMEPEDLDMLIEAARRLPVLMITLAPENTTTRQVRALAEAGALVSLGHSDADYETCMAHIAAGARCATHLFNAMSQLRNRAPGLVGAALEAGGLWAGLIADGIHVHPADIRIAHRAKRGPGGLFLVTDAMATAGTELERFSLNGREIRRENDRLTLADGTLAGADLALCDALRFISETLEIGPAEALTMASSAPAGLAGLAPAGHLAPGGPADFIHLDDGFALKGVWQGGRRVA